MKSAPLLQLFSLMTVVVGQGKVVMCYYTNWSQYRVGKRFYPENINAHYCTHLIFSFAKVSSSNQLANYEWNDIVTYNSTAGLYYRFTQLKKQNPNLKTLLAVGGYNHGSGPFSRMTASAATRRTFITNAISWLRDNNFDGLDIDWEYPGSNDKANFVLLVKELREAFQTEASRTGQPALLLTAAVAAGYSKVETGYDVPALNQYLDYINLMAYDLHGAWDRKTGHNAGLYTATTDTENFSVSEVAMNWVRLGAERSKILVGLATYGRTWTLTNAADHSVGAPASGPGQTWPYSRTGGVMFYYEVCDALQNKGYTYVFDSQTKTPYAYSGDQWITFDNILSLQYKMTWIIENGFGGAIVWAIEEDDYDGSGCGQGPYPLLRIIHQCLVEGQNCAPSDGGIVPTFRPPTAMPITTEPPFPTRGPTTIHHPPPLFRTRYPLVTAAPVTKTGDPQCPFWNGLFRDLHDCSAYWVCRLPYIKQRFRCAPHTVFSQDLLTCVHPYTTDCFSSLIHYQ